MPTRCELRLARATAPSPRGPTPPRCSRAAAAVADRLVASHLPLAPESERAAPTVPGGSGAEYAMAWREHGRLHTQHGLPAAEPGDWRNGVTAAGSELPSEGAPTGGHARRAAHAHSTPEHRQRARASRTQAADTLRPILAPDWCVGSAQRRTGTSLRAAEGARGATRRELGRRPTAPEDHGARGVHRGGCPGPRDELSEWRASRRKKRREGCRAAAGRRRKHRAATLSIARRLGSHATLRVARCDA